ARAGQHHLRYSPGRQSTQRHSERPGQSVSVPGTFVYSPGAGTILHAGNNQPLTVAFTPTDTTDFNTATGGTTINVLKAPLTVTAVASNKTYDGTRTAAVSLSDNHLGSDNVTESFTLATFDTKNAGTGKTVTITGITIGGADAGNYALQNTTANTIANISARTLTVTATGVNRVYDGTTAATVALSDNHLAGDTVTDAYGAAAFSDSSVGSGKTVSVS